MPHYDKLAHILRPIATKPPCYCFATRGAVQTGTASLDTQVESLRQGRPLGLLPYYLPAMLEVTLVRGGHRRPDYSHVG